MKAGVARLLNERMRQAYQELEAFSYTISHDLKSPIASIKSYAATHTRSNGRGPGQKMLKRIAQRADQMNLMIHAVLEYLKVGTLGLRFQDINMDVLLQDITEDLELLNHSNELEITIGATPASI